MFWKLLIVNVEMNSNGLSTKRNLMKIEIKLGGTCCGTLTFSNYFGMLMIITKHLIMNSKHWHGFESYLTARFHMAGVHQMGPKWEMQR